jgi:hypothetical protein
MAEGIETLSTFFSQIHRQLEGEKIPVGEIP